MPRQNVSVRAALGPHLPYLRRHARALSGNQQSGDTYVRAALEALLISPDAAQLDLDKPRRTLFRVFHAFWVPHRAMQPGSNADTSDMLSLTGHEALLLTTVEGFSVDDAAVILQRDPASIVDEVAAARASIAAAIRSNVLIIEDEPIIAMHLEQIVEDMGHVVSAMAMTRAEAVQAAAASPPDLVLADIQLADGSSGVDAVNDILQDFDVPVVFITAYPERLLTGERPEPTYLVSKPFAVDTIVATIGQALLSHIYRKNRSLQPS